MPGRHKVARDELLEDATNIRRTGFFGGAQGVCEEHLAQWEKQKVEAAGADRGNRAE